MLLIPSLCFCTFSCASTTCCGTICWTVGAKWLGFMRTLQVMGGPSNRRFPLQLQSWESSGREGVHGWERWWRKWKCPHPDTARKRIISHAVLGCPWGRCGEGQAARLVVVVLLPCCTGHGLDCFYSPSTATLLKSLVTEFIPFLYFTHMLFAEKKDKWWRVF